ncbi:HpcH/HpaI aldolase/citrate lyase family protein [Agromyces sp. SYSU T00194]|uniref:HpcH/HpaI aldolase/citrate lyase family protein n=1 Tax=Agromyces chitinivorans TaxID=3158560 RepID=UPI0033949E2C
MTFTMGPALLFCPADRPERFRKAADRADAVILDLEDAVGPDAKADARAAVAESGLDADRTIVRINPAGSPDFAADLAAVAAGGFHTVMLAKASGTADLVPLRDYRVVALCETPAGVIAAPDIASVECVVALMWGAEDLVGALGGSSSRTPDGGYRDVARHARASVLLAAGAHGIAAIDAVHLDIADEAGQAAEATDAAASGFAATACIHPGQVSVVREAYRPSEEELAAARELLSAASGRDGVFTHDGRMIDAPVLRQAERVVARAARR